MVLAFILSFLSILYSPNVLYYPHLRHVSTLQLHMFCDGSSMAYAACAYLRASCTDGSVKVILLVARSRVTPVKPLTFPRVELSGAVLCTQLAEWIINQLQASYTPYPYTTDRMQ